MILDAIITEIAVDLARKAVDLAYQKLKDYLREKDIKGSVVKGEFVADHAGHVLIKVKNLQEVSEIVVLWGPWMRKLTLQPSPAQYLILTKGADSIPVIVFSSSKASFEFISDVTNIVDDEWIKVS